MDLYSGPEYLIHFRYSSMLNVIFVTFMYGMALPVLFPIAFLFFVILYVQERFLITYYYKKPPVYDEKLNKAAIKISKWAPFLMVTFSYWAMGNKQIFSNVAIPVVYRNDPITTDHYMIDLEVSQALPLFFCTIIFFIGTFFNNVFIKCLEKVDVCEKH